MPSKQIKDFTNVVASVRADKFLTQQSADNVTRYATITQIFALLLNSDVGLGNVDNKKQMAVDGSAQATGTIKWAKGADVASANALTLGTDGNYFDITGTTSITSIATKGVGTIVLLHFDGILTLTYHATNLILPGAANITTAAGDEAIFIEYATGGWRCLSYEKAAGGPINATAEHNSNGTHKPISIATSAPATPVAKTLYEDSFHKAWLDQTGTTTPTIGDSVNISSITDNGVGDRIPNFATNMANATFVQWQSNNPNLGGAFYGNGAIITSRAVSSYRYVFEVLDASAIGTGNDLTGNSGVVGNN